MLYYASLFFLVIAVSTDGFGVGITYGLRNIRVPFGSLLIVMVCSGAIVLLSMTIGGLLGDIITPRQSRAIGGIILILLGLFSLVNILAVKDENKKAKPMLEGMIKAPIQADLDGSGSIAPKEAFLLGIALAMDAFGAGLGASLIGYSPFLTAFLISAMSGLFLFSGIKTGILLSKNSQLQQLTYLPPFLLILLGIVNTL